MASDTKESYYAECIRLDKERRIKESNDRDLIITALRDIAETLTSVHEDLIRLDITMERNFGEIGREKGGLGGESRVVERDNPIAPGGEGR